MYESVQMEFTFVHLAAREGLYYVLHYFIDELGFNIDFYKPPNHRLTLLHVIAKFRKDPFTQEDKELIIKLINKSNNLLLRNNFGKTIVMQAKTFNNLNYEFLKEEITRAIGEKMRGMAFIVDKVLRKQHKVMNKYMIRDIYKYVDG